ncbi:flavin reductase family protein [Mycolicibacterium smegmatis]|uniref:flavin reductase family protein n=1 Tax=Mycolicibacterium smegmatis TaxID=1772 RepID=UPI0020A5C974|nr:flavin reductase family protein [Mycolicibacterium smegmatis]MCP2626814.1 flavin reductase family protein [Mycolicibacterium smegmatis]
MTPQRSDSTEYAFGEIRGGPEDSAIRAPKSLVNTTDPAGLRRAFAAHPSGVTAVGAMCDGTPTGMTVATFVPVSLQPALVSICIGMTSSTWPRLRTAGRLGLSTLSDAQERECKQLSAKETDRFAAVSYQVTPAGAILLHNASAWIECSIEDELKAGDHFVVLLRVEAIAFDSRSTPLVFHASKLQPLR